MWEKKIGNSNPSWEVEKFECDRNIDRDAEGR